jgi:hypothetical protein
MKRILLMSVGLVMLVAALAAAQTPAAPGPQPPAGQGANFVDANGDGICDRFEPGVARQGQGQRQGPRDGTGQQVRRGGQGRGAGAGAGQKMGPGPGAGPGTATCDGTGPKGRGRGNR